MIFTENLLSFIHSVLLGLSNFWTLTFLQTGEPFSPSATEEPGSTRLPVEKSFVSRYVVVFFMASRMWRHPTGNQSEGASRISAWSHNFSFSGFIFSRCCQWFNSASVISLRGNLKGKLQLVKDFQINLIFLLGSLESLGPFFGNYDSLVYNRQIIFMLKIARTVGGRYMCSGVRCHCICLCPYCCLCHCHMSLRVWRIFRSFKGFVVTHKENQNNPLNHQRI